MVPFEKVPFEELPLFIQAILVVSSVLVLVIGGRWVRFLLRSIRGRGDGKSP